MERRVWLRSPVWVGDTALWDAFTNKYGRNRRGTAGTKLPGEIGIELTKRGCMQVNGSPLRTPAMYYSTYVYIFHPKRRGIGNRWIHTTPSMSSVVTSCKGSVGVEICSFPGWRKGRACSLCYKFHKSFICKRATDDTKYVLCCYLLYEKSFVPFLVGENVVLICHTILWISWELHW